MALHWRRSRQLGLLAFVAVLLVLAFHLGGGWYFADQLDERAFSAHARREALSPEYTVEVLEAGDTILLRDPDNTRLNQDGIFGFGWPGGWGILSKLVEVTADGDARWEYRVVEAGDGIPDYVDVDTRVYPGDPMRGLGITFENITIAGELGDYPAWFVPGAGTTWFVFVHGNGMTRLDSLRVLPPVVREGMPILVPTVRGDDGAPDASGGRLACGRSEWRDLEAAVQYALDHGAESVVIEGMSMGGAIVASFLLNSSLAEKADGVIFDAAALDLERAVEHQAKDESIPVLGLPLPGTLVDTAEWLAERRFGIDWSEIDYLARIEEFETPALLIHGDADKKVPLALSQEFASKRADLVRGFLIVQGAGHLESWNVASMEYEAQLTRFIRGVAR